MQSLNALLNERVGAALAKIAPEQDIPEDVIVPSQNAAFGDYQCNIAMRLAKALKQNPRQIAQQVIDELDVSDCSERPEIAGPGFINFRIRTDYLPAFLHEMATDERLGFETTPTAKTVVVDFSGPNLAKEMHVGHLRSTIIGDCVARFLEFEGHNVLRMNHVGDWGTQFGMLIQYIRQTHGDDFDPASFAIDDLESFYREARKCFDDSEAFANASRQAVVDLQAGDADTLAIWKIFCDESLRHCHDIYDKLDIELTDRGESAYNDRLSAVVSDLTTAGLATETEGAKGVFLDGYTNKDNEPLPLIVQKSDGGYNYATTDLAAIRYRVDEQHADRIIYVTGAPQKQHFQMVFETAAKADWAKRERLEHLGFGSMLGADGKVFRTREGGTVKLKALIQEAEERATVVARELGAELSDEEILNVAKVAGRATIKYADLTHAFATDYKFAWDKMLAKDGNTAVYLLYSYARTRAIGRRAEIDIDSKLSHPDYILSTEQEVRLAKKLAHTPGIWPLVVRDLTPHVLIAHLFELAKLFSSFYDACPILKDGVSEDVRESRLALTALVGKQLKWGLSMIGIPTLERM